MLRKIYSNVDPHKVLHIVYTHEQNSEGMFKQPLADPEHAIQAIRMHLPANTEVKPHGHHPQERITQQTQEGLLVLKGSLELSIYDVDKSLVEKMILKEGDCYLLINGGHSIKTLTPVEIFEFKNGPYYGAEKDKLVY